MSKTQRTKESTPTKVTPVAEKLITRFRQRVDEDNRQRVDAMSPEEVRQALGQYLRETK